jgi:glutamine amidotransferase
MLVIIDYDSGNIKSVVNAIKKCQIEFEVSSDSKLIMSAKKLILPGVSNFSHCIKELKKKNLDKLICEEVLYKKKPFLGICSGMQILATHSEEGDIEGLNIIPGKVIKLLKKKLIPVPHMGWNKVKFENKDNVVNQIDDLTRFYFCHSYHFVPDDKKNILMTVNYGDIICCGVKKENIYGIQFHPEKSQKYGLSILKNFYNHCN